MVSFQTGSKIRNQFFADDTQKVQLKVAWRELLAVSIKNKFVMFVPVVLEEQSPLLQRIYLWSARVDTI